MYSCTIDVEDQLVVHQDGNLLRRDDYRVRKIGYPSWNQAGRRVSWYVILTDGSLLNVSVRKGPGNSEQAEIEVVDIQGLELLDVISHDYRGRRLGCVTTDAFLIDVNHQLYSYHHLGAPQKIRVKIPYPNLKLHNLDGVAYGEYRLWLSSDDQIIVVKINRELRASLTAYTAIEEIDYISLSRDGHNCIQVRIGNSSQEVQIFDLDFLSCRPDLDLSRLNFRPTWVASNGTTSYYHDGRRLLVNGDQQKFIEAPEFREVMMMSSGSHGGQAGLGIDYHDNLYQLTGPELVPRLLVSGIGSFRRTPYQASAKIKSVTFNE